MDSFDKAFQASANPAIPANFSVSPWKSGGTTLSGPLVGAASWAITAQLVALGLSADIATVYQDLREALGEAGVGARRPTGSTRLGRLMQGLKINPGDNVMDEPSIIGLRISMQPQDILPIAMSRVAVAWKAIALQHATKATAWRRVSFDSAALPWLLPENDATRKLWSVAAAMGSYGTPAILELNPQGAEQIPNACAVASLTLHFESTLPCFKVVADLDNWLKSQATDTPIVVKPGPGQSLKVRAVSLNRAVTLGAKVFPPTCVDPNWLACRNNGYSIIDP